MPQAIGKAHWDALADQFTEWGKDPENFLTRRAGHIADFIRDTVPPCRSLEVGCGPGLLLEDLLSSVYDAHACCTHAFDESYRRLPDRFPPG
jgi:hypothetical protein